MINIRVVKDLRKTIQKSKKPEEMLEEPVIFLTSQNISGNKMSNTLRNEKKDGK